MISPIFQHSSREHLPKLLDDLIAAMGERAFRGKAAEQMLAATRPERVLPPSLAHFAPLLTRGLEFFLSCISARRLRAVILELLAHASETAENDRLFHLALCFPTLHKLGQVIARKPDIDPGIREWLVQLEKGDYGTAPDRQIGRITEQLAGRPAAESIIVSPKIVAEASVAVVIAFTWHAEGEEQPRQGVFKLLKPDIREKLEEELHALGKTAVFLEMSRHELGLKETKVSALFQELRLDLEKEIDLATEQQKLVEAANAYIADSRVRIPRVLPFCSQDMTAMEFMAGVHITEVVLPQGQHSDLAELVFKALLCMPLFEKGEYALFHGDPHAGNILAVSGSAGGEPQIVLLDWALSGYLGKGQRLQIMQLLLGVLKADSSAVSRAVSRLARDSSHGKTPGTSFLQKEIEGLMAAPEYLECDPLKKAFWLLEQVTMLGVVFPSELILYRKAFFTLEGVLHDISPGFSMGESMERYLRQLLMQELPFRYGVSFLPLCDHASLYRTMLSNSDLHELVTHQICTGWRKAMEGCSTFVAANMNLAMDFYFVLPGRLFFACCR